MKAPFIMTLIIVLALMVAFPAGGAIDRWLIWIALAFFIGTAWIFHKVKA